MKKEEGETREEPGRHLLEINVNPKTHFDLNLDKEDFFAIDTTKVWMAVNIKVNFSEENVRLLLYARSKKDKLFAWQALIRAEGKFSDIKLATNPVDLTAAYFSFITSPLHVPARWMFGDKVPEDASAICELLYDRDYVRKLHEKYKSEEQKEISEWLDSDQFNEIWFIHTVQ